MSGCGDDAGSAEARVVFCTSKSGAQDIHRGIGAGADDWIVKPFDPAKLVDAVRRVAA